MKYRCVVRIIFLENGSLFKVNDGRGELKTNSGRFPRGSKTGKFSHDNEYGHGQEKRRPSTYVEGTIASYAIVKDSPYVVWRTTSDMIETTLSPVQCCSGYGFIALFPRHRLLLGLSRLSKARPGWPPELALDL